MLTPEKHTNLHSKPIVTTHDNTEDAAWQPWMYGHILIQISSHLHI